MGDQVRCTPEADQEAPTTREAERREPAPTVEGTVERVEGSGGPARVHARVPAGAFTLVLLWTVGDPEVAFNVVRVGDYVAEGCQLGLMIDSHVRALPDARMVTIDDQYGYGSPVSFDLLRAMANGTRVAGRVCGAEWRLTDAGRGLVAEFVARIDEESAWSASTQAAPVDDDHADQAVVAP